MSTEQKEREPNPNVNSDNSDNLTSESEHEEKQQEQAPLQSSTRTPFTNLSQVDADLALARTLQEQERVCLMLRMNNDGIDYGSWEAGSYLLDYYDDNDDDFGDPHDHYGTDGDDSDEEDDDDQAEYDVTDADDDVHAHAENVEEDNHPSVEFDLAVFSSDEAYARALQDAEEREMAARLLALARINDRGTVTLEDHEGNSQDTWEEVDPDELSYEELLALGEVVGTESRGLSADSLASLPSVTYKEGSSQIGSNDLCVICHVDYEDGDSLTVLSCKHFYHPECINNWLKINRVCPVCSAEVSTSGQS